MGIDLLLFVVAIGDKEYKKLEEMGFKLQYNDGNIILSMPSNRWNIDDVDNDARKLCEMAGISESSIYEFTNNKGRSDVFNMHNKSSSPHVIIDRSGFGINKRAMLVLNKKDPNSSRIAINIVNNMGEYVGYKSKLPEKPNSKLYELDLSDGKRSSIRINGGLANNSALLTNPKTNQTDYNLFKKFNYPNNEPQMVQPFRQPYFLNTYPMGRNMYGMYPNQQAFNNVIPGMQRDNVNTYYQYLMAMRAKQLGQQMFSNRYYNNNVGNNFSFPGRFSQRHPGPGFGGMGGK